MLWVNILVPAEVQNGGGNYLVYLRKYFVFDK